LTSSTTKYLQVQMHQVLRCFFQGTRLTLSNRRMYRASRSLLFRVCSILKSRRWEISLSETAATMTGTPWSCYSKSNKPKMTPSGWN